MVIRELSDHDSHLAHPPMAHLRPSLRAEEDFVAGVAHQRKYGYRLIAVLDEDGSGAALACAGFRQGRSLSWGEYIYIDDLVTHPDHQRSGHGSALLAWIVQEARRLGCDEVHLDSGAQRHDAHRLYLGRGFQIRALHFSTTLAGA